MRNQSLFLLVMGLSIHHIGHTKTTDSETLYFPIQVGNIWYYEDPDTITNPWDILTISDSTQIKGQKYFIWERGPGVDVSDTIRYDGSHNVLRYIHGETHLWFDFTQDSGAVYSYTPPDADFGDEQYGYQVHVHRNISAATPLKIFSKCIEFLFDIPQVIDEEHIYIFAPNVGLVLEQSNGWWMNVLHDYILYPTSTDVNHSGTSITDFRLHQNVPNPFNAFTTIGFDLAKNSRVQLIVYDIRGRIVSRLLNATLPIGYYQIPFHAAGLPSGIYIYRLQTSLSNQARKLIIQK
jgi:hypothetical protein